MGNYNGIQLPRLDEKSMDSKKERKQILNYLALLDEKLRYMFQNIDIEENLSEDSRKYLFEQGEAILNVVKDTEGNFSAFRQEVDDITLQVENVDGRMSALQLTADGLAARVSDAETGISEMAQTAAGIGTRVTNLEGTVSTVEQTANSIRTTVSNLGGNIDDLTEEVEAAYSMAEQAEDHFSWIVASGTSASRMTLTDEFLEIVADEINIDADINLYGLMRVYEDDSLDRRAGYIGYDVVDDQFSGSAEGIKISDYYDDCFVIAHGSGVTLMADGYGAYLYYYDGNFMPTEDGDQMMGDPDFRWQGVYAKNGTIQTSDRRKKKDIGYDLEKYEGFFEDLKPTQYKMIDGESGRYHIGFISQDVEGSLANNNLTTEDFAGFIKTPKRAVRDDADSEILDYHYSLRYDEFVALNTHMIQKLMARVSELEAKIEAS